MQKRKGLEVPCLVNVKVLGQIFSELEPIIKGLCIKYL